MEPDGKLPGPVAALVKRTAASVVSCIVVALVAAMFVKDSTAEWF